MAVVHTVLDSYDDSTKVACASMKSAGFATVDDKDNFINSLSDPLNYPEGVPTGASISIMTNPIVGPLLFFWWFWWYGY